MVKSIKLMLPSQLFAMAVSQICVTLSAAPRFNCLLNKSNDKLLFFLLNDVRHHAYGQARQCADIVKSLNFVGFALLWN